MVSVRKFINPDKHLKYLDLKLLSFDDYLEVGIVTGMTKGQIYIFSEVGAQIFPCWMLIVKIADCEFLWPVLVAEYEKMAVSTEYWYDLVVDNRLQFVCGETYDFQVPFRYLYGHLMTCAKDEPCYIETDLHITLEKVKIDLKPGQFGNIDVCRLLVVDSDTPQLIVGKEAYIAEIKPLDRTGFIDWRHHSTYKWRRTNSKDIVQIVPTIAIELNESGRVARRWLGQEILADWQPFCKGEGENQAIGVKAQIGDLHFVHYNTKRLQVHRWRDI